MNVARAIDLEDTEGLIAADRGALLRAASMAGAQVRAIAAAADEGELDLLRGSDRPRSVIWVTGRGTAETAGTILASTLGAGAAEPIVRPTAPRGAAGIAHAPMVTVKHRGVDGCACPALRRRWCTIAFRS